MKKTRDFRKNNRSGWDRQEQLWRGQKTKRPEPVRHKKKKREREKGGASIKDVSSSSWCDKWLHSSDLLLLTALNSNSDKGSEGKREREGETHERHREVENKNEGQKQVYVETESDKKMRGKTGMKMEQGRTGDKETEMIFFKKCIGIPRRSPMQHRASGALTMTKRASTVPPAGS